MTHGRKIQLRDLRPREPHDGHSRDGAHMVMEVNGEKGIPKGMKRPQLLQSPTSTLRDTLS